MNEIEKTIAYLKDAAKIAEKNNLKQEVFEETKNIINTAIAALEKQTAKKPLEHSYVQEEFDNGTDYLCPNCKALVGTYSDAIEDWLGQQKHCADCGQKIEWSEVQ